MDFNHDQPLFTITIKKLLAEIKPQNMQLSYNCVISIFFYQKCLDNKQNMDLTSSVVFTDIKIYIRNLILNLNSFVNSLATFSVSLVSFT